MTCMGRNLQVGLVGCLLSVLLIPTVGHAQDDDFDVNATYEEANRLVSRGGLSRALELYQQVVEHDDTWIDAWYNMGEVSRVLEQWDTCALYFSRFVYLDPEAAGEVAEGLAECTGHIEESAQISVTAEPSEAKIAIDGVVLARGSLPPFTTSAGAHQITVERRDYATASQSVTLAAGATETIAITLDAIPFYGTLRVEANVEGAHVEIEGSAVGTTPVAEPLRLLEGQHLVRLSKEGYYDWLRRVDITRDHELVLEVEMQVEEDESSRGRRY